MITAANDDCFDFSNSGSSSNSNLSYSDKLGDKITLLAGQINAANYRFLKMIAEFDRLEAWAGYGLRSCAHWMDWKCGISLGASREKVRVARALDELIDINKAFEKGELSYSKVRAMTRVATKENEEYLLMIAQYGTAQQLEKLVSSFRSVCLHDVCESDLRYEKIEQEYAAELSEQALQEQARSLIYYQDDDGMWMIKAKLTTEEGGLLVKLITALAEQITDDVNAKDAESVDIDTTKLDSSVDGACKEESVPAESGFIADQRISFAQSRADALVMIAEQFWANDQAGLIAGSAGLKGAERCQLMLHIHAGADSSISANLDGHWIGLEAAKRLACDASLVVVEEDEVGNVLNIGRRSRIIPASMSRALSIRDDGHCQFPGCCESRYVEGHHIKHWAVGGETKLDNLVTLCRYHHRELHRGQFFLSLKAEAVDSGLNDSKKGKSRFAERLCFSRAGTGFDGHVYKEGEVVIEANPRNPVAARGVVLPGSVIGRVGISSAVTRWLGERMDLGMAVDGLLGASRDKI